jgi:NAD/NADP transhydrogenase alpha subunit
MAYDSRRNTKEQVESLGATFIDIEIKEESLGSGKIAII